MNELLERRSQEVFNVSELSMKFLNYIDVSPKTIETYKIALNQFSNYLQKNLIVNPTRNDIVSYKEEIKKDLRPTTVNSYMIALRNFFKFLEYEGLYQNITENVKGIKLEKRHLKVGLSLEEVQRVLRACQNTKEVLMIKMFINLGLRENELVNIKLEDFYKDGEITMLKILGKGRGGEKQDTIKIDNRLLDAIKIYVKDYAIKDYLFTSDCHRNIGGQMSTSGIRHLIKSLFEKAELDNLELKSCHSLRHTTTELLLKSGTPIQEVSEYLRHQSISTTMIYSRELNQKESLCTNLLADNLF